MRSGVSNPSASVHAHVWLSVGVRKESSRRAELVRLWGEKRISMASWMLTMWGLVGSASGRSASSSSMLAKRELSALSLPPGAQPPVLHCSLFPGLMVSQVRQFHGRKNHEFGLAVRWFLIAVVMVWSSQVWGPVMGAPVGNWWASPALQEYQQPESLYKIKVIYLFRVC